MEKTFAVIENDVVVNCIVATSKEEAEQITQLQCVEYLNVEVGFHYQNEVFSKPLT
jgi:hypothetical protein